MQAATCLHDAASANDNLDAYLDRELADLQLDFGDVLPIPAVTNLDGTPCEADPAPARPLAGNPKKGSAKTRVSYARDRRNLPTFNDFVPDVRPVAQRGPRRPLVDDTPSPTDPLSTPSHTGQNTPSTSTTKRRKADENDTRAAPAWSRTTDIIRGHAYARSVSTTGGGLSWTLNLGGKVAQAANDNPKGLKVKMHDRLSKALKASPLGARDFVFSVERTKDGRWHCHGMLDGSDSEKDVLDVVLRKTGGAWDSAHHRDKQTDVRIAWGPDGWMRYIQKDSAATRRLLGTMSVLSVTRGCRQRAEELWEASRRDPQELHQDARQLAKTLASPTTAPALVEAAQGRVTRTTTWTWTLTSYPSTLHDPAGQFRPSPTARSRGPPCSGIGELVSHHLVP